MAVMMAPKETWTDERLDDLKEGMGKRFDQVDANFTRVDADIRELRGDVKELGREMNTRFDAMHRMMVHGFIAMGGITVTCFVGLAGLIVF